MKYKVGDEVLIKAKIITGVRKYFGVEVEDNRFDVCEDDIIPVPGMTAEEAWKILSKILLYPANGGYSAKELEEIFGTTEHLWELQPQEAKAKIEAWEAEKEIKVGDVVRSKHYESREYLVTYISKNRIMAGVCLQTGEVIPEKSEVSTNSMVKTGRHINIDEILKQIGGDE